MVIENVRSLIRNGGRAVFRWSIRFALMGIAIVCGFISYDFEVAGLCRIVPTSQVGVRAQIADEIVRIHVAEGDWVDIGAPIATLSVRDEVAAAETLKAQLKGAKAELDLLCAGPRAEDVAIAEQKLDLCRSQLAYRESELSDLKKLHAENATALLDVKKAQQSRDEAQNASMAAQENLTRIKQGAREQEILVAQAEVERIEAELRHVEQTVQLGRLTAPIAGRVVTQNIQERVGQSVQPGDLIAVLHDTAKLRAEVAADEAAAVHVKKGMRVKLRLNGTDGKLLTGAVHHVTWKTIDQRQFDIEPIRSDRESRVEEAIEKQEAHHIRICVDLDPHQENLVPGMTGNARIVIRSGQFWEALLRPVLRFVRVDVWSWLP